MKKYECNVFTRKRVVITIAITYDKRTYFLHTVSGDGMELCLPYTPQHKCQGHLGKVKVKKANCKPDTFTFLFVVLNNKQIQLYVCFNF